MDFYLQASAILTKLDNKVGSIKGLTLHSGEKNGPRTYALILETLKYRDVLRQVIINSELLVKERKLAAQGNLPLVLVHDLLLNKGGIVANAGPFKDAVLRHKTRLQAEWIKAKIRLKAKDNIQLAKVDATFIPRWARVNTLKISLQAFMLELRDFTVVETLEELRMDCVHVDRHIDNLLAFYPRQQLTAHKHYLNGSLIFQNKASCIPAAVLNPPPGATVVDACAAPGNKTSHLAAILNGTGQLIAFERDTRRVGVLREMMAKSESAVEVIHADFTHADPYDPRFSNVTHLLLDPSCSGSGIVNRLDYLTDDPPFSSSSTTAAVSPDFEHDALTSTRGDGVQVSSAPDTTRLEALSSFQVALLLHAMKFPSAEKITYSTCSVHAAENERVVMTVLGKRQDWRTTSRSETLPQWPCRGVVEECDGHEEVAEGLIRARPGTMGTIGFFVACFVKKATTGGKRKAEEAIFMPDDDDEGGEEVDDEDKFAHGEGNGVPKTDKRKKRKKKKKKKSKQDLGGLILEG